MTVETASVEIRIPKVFESILQAWSDGKRRVLLEGGTSSSKTFSALQALIVICEKAPRPILISVVSESLPHLKRGCIRDFFSIMKESPDHSPYWSKTEFIYSRPEWQGRIEFFGADDDGKVRGPRRDILFMNEGNNIPWPTAQGLDIRTSTFTIVDWNPVSAFWAHEYWLGEDNTSYDHSTYRDAVEVLPQQVVVDIESYRDKDPNWWNIYGLGKIGKVEGLVHPNFEQVDTLPTGDTGYGLDFGFAADPTVLVKNVIVGENLYSQQMFYNWYPMTNDDIAREMDLLRVSHSTPIFPDPNEPKSAEELRRKGFCVIEPEKGPGSVKFGIKKVNSYYQHWTKGSVDCIKEQRNFRYLKRREPQTGLEYLTEDTTHRWSHGMSARRYGVTKVSLLSTGQTSKAVSNH